MISKPLDEKHLASELYYKYKFNIKGYKLVNKGNVVERRWGTYLNYKEKQLLNALKSQFTDYSDRVSKLAVHNCIENL